MVEVTKSSLNQEPKTEEKKDIPKVMDGVSPIKKEKSTAQTFKDNFFKEDLKTVKNAVITEVLVPQIQNLLMSIVNNALSLWLTGSKTSVNTQNPNQTRISFVNYDNMFAKKQSTTQIVANNKDKYLSQIVIPVPSEKKGTELIEKICAVVEQYNNISVNDLYDMIGCMDEVPSTMCNYGWKERDMRKIKLGSDRDGWYVAMPEMTVI